MAAVASSRWMLHIGGGWGYSPFYVKRFEYPEKCYINVTNYYYKYLPFFIFFLFCYLERLYNREISLAVLLRQLAKVVKPTWQRTVIKSWFSKKKLWYYIFPYRPLLHQTQQCRWPEGRYQSNLGFHYTWAVPQADCLHAPRCIDAVIHAKGGPTKYWVHRNENTFQKPYISV